MVTPDYTPCKGWPSTCFSCRHAVLTDVYFCKAYNLRHFGQERVQVELIADNRPWWVRERSRRRSR